MSDDLIYPTQSDEKTLTRLRMTPMLLRADHLSAAFGAILARANRRERHPINARYVDGTRAQDIDPDSFNDLVRIDEVTSVNTIVYFADESSLYYSVDRSGVEAVAWHKQQDNDAIKAYYAAKHALDSATPRPKRRTVLLKGMSVFLIIGLLGSALIYAIDKTFNLGTLASISIALPLSVLLSGLSWRLANWIDNLSSQWLFYNNKQLSRLGVVEWTGIGVLAVTAIGTTLGFVFN